MNNNKKLELILQKTSDVTGVPIKDIKGKSRLAHVCSARTVFAIIAHKYAGFNCTLVARKIDKHHATIIWLARSDRFQGVPFFKSCMDAMIKYVGELGISTKPPTRPAKKLMTVSEPFNSEFKIEKNVPMPVSRHGNPTKRSVFVGLISQMEPMDSFFVPIDFKEERVKYGRVTAQVHYVARMQEKKLAIRKTKDGMRIWRVK